LNTKFSFDWIRLCDSNLSLRPILSVFIVEVFLRVSDVNDKDITRPNDSSDVDFPSLPTDRNGKHFCEQQQYDS